MNYGKWKADSNRPLLCLPLSLFWILARFLFNQSETRRLDRDQSTLNHRPKHEQGPLRKVSICQILKVRDIFSKKCNEVLKNGKKEHELLLWLVFHYKMGSYIIILTKLERHKLSKKIFTFIFLSKLLSFNFTKFLKPSVTCIYYSWKCDMFGPTFFIFSIFMKYPMKCKK